MTVSVAVTLSVKTTETLTSNVPAASARGNAITHDGFDTTLALNASSTPPATVCAYFTKALSSGTATIDLTALTGTQGTVDGTGLKVQSLIFKNAAANQVTISKGATNGYSIFGASGSVVVPAGSTLAMTFADTLADISSTVKTLDLAGTGSQSFSVGIVMG